MMECVCSFKPSPLTWQVASRWRQKPRMREQSSFSRTWLSLMRSPAFACLFAFQLLLYLSPYIAQEPVREVRYLGLVDSEPPPGTPQVQYFPVPIPAFAGRDESLSGFSTLYKSLVAAGTGFNVLPQMGTDLIFKPARRAFATPRGVLLSELYALTAITLSICQWFLLLPMLVHTVRVAQRWSGSGVPT